jgi:uncharacterized protein (DUF433 family)
MAQEKLDYKDRITIDPRVMVGKPVVRGTRIPVERVLARLADNPNPDDLLIAFPELTRDDVRAVLAYAENRVAEPGQDGERTTPSSLVSPEAFYKQLTSRADIREILTRLAK